jgi:hypothetical protein
MIDEDSKAARSSAFRNDSEISVRVDGKSDHGLGYGAVIDLEADVTEDADNEGVNAARTYLFLDSGMGRLELGSNTGAAEAMKLDASNIARATGGIDGAWTYFATDPGTDSFITTPSLPVGHGSTASLGDESFDNANKISYYSPRMSGFQLGLSYTQEAGDRGQTITLENDSTASDVVDAAVSYEGSWDEMSLGLAATYQMGAGTGVGALPVGSEDIEAYNVGASFGFSGFTLAGSYGDWSDSINTAGVDGDYWTAGAGFDIGAVGTSVTYMESSLGDNDFNNLVVGADYSLAAGLTPYAEVSMYEFDGVTVADDNDGTAVILGTQLAF